ncbi:MAG: hypothetical protein A2Z18_02535 [Armatimonadetes bacterium RBG_16_58_9]|nr:MAG: hypothetical protein A2Z18_02535 [Armatimonadetes bacterium RBG_16_58_9]
MANCINDNGQIVGYQSPTAGPAQPIVWADGRASQLGSLGGDGGSASGINNAGQICGHASTAAGKAHSFISENGVMTDLAPSDPLQHVANAMNEFGHVVGTSPNYAYLWKDGQMTLLGSLGGGGTDARAVNDFDEVVGYSATSRLRGQYHAFIWRNGVMTDIGHLGGGFSIGLGINNFGEVVGYSSTSNGGDAPFIWQKGVIKNLNDLIDPYSGWVLTNAFDINEAGQIVGSGRYNNVYHAFLLTLVPEPSTILALLCGIGALPLLRRRRA